MTPFSEGQEDRIRKAVELRIDEYRSQGFNDPGFSAAAITSQARRDHVTAIGVSILCTKWGIGYPGGDFVKSIVNNDLIQTIQSADHINLNAIRFYVYLIRNQVYVV